MSLEEIFLHVTTDEPAERRLRVQQRVTQRRQTVTAIRNIFAIAGKELRSYFASPIAYVIIGLLALLFGWFFYVLPRSSS